MSSSASKSAPRARDSWSGQTGFLLAAIGSAIGLMVVVGFAKMATGHLGESPTAAYVRVAGRSHDRTV